MSLTAINNEEVVLNSILRYLKIYYNAQVMQNELIVEFDENKIIEVLSKITKEYSETYKNYTGNKYIYAKEIEKITVRIGNYEFCAKEEFETKQTPISKGFKKIS